ncbi:MAG: translation elongation factor-like protein [Candidatus Aenigmarchaeota archaeon]|nr:translation elongation factor-like protein [Candidatus Aenigmarchaeota archaeon]
MKKPIGKITHYYGNIGVAVIELEDTLKEGDKISIEGTTTKFTQEVGSMQLNHENVKSAKKGDAIGMKVAERVRLGDVCYLAD